MRYLKYLFILLLPLGLLGCGGSSGNGNGGAPASYVPPGEKDDYYLFYSGGHSGQVFAAGLPSLRQIQTIPVFTPSPGHGYGFSKKSKEMMGEYRWGDVHHPGLSKTDGTYDGRWLFVNDNANNRVARISLRDFKTKQILGPIPNSMGNHGSSFVTPNTEYLLVATRFSVPLPKGRHAPIETYEENFNGIVNGLKVDQETGEMSVGWQVKTPPFNWDLGSTGKGPSDGWAFWTSYNTEMAHDSLEINASQRDRDFAAFVNWERAEEVVQNNDIDTRNGVPLIDPAEHEGVMYFVPVSKSPHGIDASPSGRWIVASGKLQPTTTVFDFEQFRTAVESEDFQGEFRGVPVINYDAVVEGEVPVGQGPLHTQYDGKGNAYTSLFIESAVARWELPPWDESTKEDLSQVVTDKISVQYNIGHLLIPGSDTKEPYGDWLVAMNKLKKDRGLSVGPEMPETSQLIDISGEEMEMIEEDYTPPEPHFAQAVPADVVDPIEVYKQENNDHPEARWDPENTGVERTGPNEVTVHMIAKRSQYYPDKVEVQRGDKVTFHLTNIEQVSDMIHGFGTAEHNMSGIVTPGETKTFTITADKAGVYPFYCTNFCSALHQEMQGYLTERPIPDRGRLLMVVGAVLLAAAIFLPLWQIHLVAPQYQEGLDLYIYSHKLEAGNEGQDLTEINNLNHYIGMQPIQEEDFAEMRFIPFLLGGFSLLALRAAFFGTVKSAIDTLVLFVYFGAFSMWRFYYQLYTYAHNLDPRAPMDIDPFTPILIGWKQIANFTQYSFPREGSALLLGAAVCFGTAIWMGIRSEADAGDVGEPESEPATA